MRVDSLLFCRPWQPGGDIQVDLWGRWRIWIYQEGRLLWRELRRRRNSTVPRQAVYCQRGGQLEWIPESQVPANYAGNQHDGSRPERTESGCCWSHHRGSIHPKMVSYCFVYACGGSVVFNARFYMLPCGRAYAGRFCGLRAFLWAFVADNFLRRYFDIFADVMLVFLRTLCWYFC